MTQNNCNCLKRYFYFKTIPSPRYTRIYNRYKIHAIVCVIMHINVLWALEMFYYIMAHYDISFHIPWDIKLTPFAFVSASCSDADTWGLLDSSRKSFSYNTVLHSRLAWFLYWFLQKQSKAGLYIFSMGHCLSSLPLGSSW